MSSVPASYLQDQLAEQQRMQSLYDEGRIGPPVKRLEKVRHRVPMLSIDNAYSIEGLKGFCERTERALNPPDLGIGRTVRLPAALSRG